MLGLLIFLAIIGVGALFGYSIIAPISGAARGKARPTRFVTSDFFSLMALLTWPMLFLSVVRQWSDQSPGHWSNSGITTFVILSILLISVVVFAWWRGASTLSGLDIYDPSRRALFLVVLMPAALVGSLVAAFALGMVFMVREISAEGLAIWVAVWIVLVVLAIGLRQLSFWVLKGRGRGG